MSYETSKAMQRRANEEHVAAVPWSKYFDGVGLDVGCGPDKIQCDDCFGFDKKDGDANHLSSYFMPKSFDYIHGSQALEHMEDPAAAIRDWMIVVKPGGYIIQTVPSWELYEGMRWPSRYNPDHKSTWSMWQPGSPAPIHCKMPQWLDQFGCKVLICRWLTTITITASELPKIKPNHLKIRWSAGSSSS